MRRLAAQFAAGTPGHLSSLLVTYCPILGAAVALNPSESESVRVRLVVRAQIMSALMPASVDGFSLSLASSAPFSLTRLLYCLKASEIC